MRHGRSSAADTKENVSRLWEEEGVIDNMDLWSHVSRCLDDNHSHPTGSDCYLPHARGSGGATAINGIPVTQFLCPPFSASLGMYWVGQQVCLGFPVRCYGKTQTNLLASSIAFCSWLQESCCPSRHHSHSSFREKVEVGNKKRQQPYQESTHFTKSYFFGPNCVIWPSPRAQRQKMNKSFGGW